MREHWPGPAPYLRAECALGELEIRGQRYAAGWDVHLAEERTSARELLLPDLPRGQERLYVHARPFIQEPTVSLLIGLYPTHQQGRPVGEVLSVCEDARRKRFIGDAQAWAYPEQKLLVLWECLLFEDWQMPTARGDAALAVLWTSFERELLRGVPETRRIVTPSWEPLYETDDWQDFLVARGYQPGTDAAFVKDVRPSDARSGPS